MKRSDALRDLATKYMDDARERQEKQYNCGRNAVHYNIGDMAKRRVHVLSDASKNFSKKLSPKYDGPYKIVDILSPEVCDLDRAAI